MEAGSNTFLHQVPPIEKKKLVAKIVVKFDYVFALFSKRIGLDSVRVKKLFSILKSYGKSLSSAKKKKVDWL